MMLRGTSVRNDGVYRLLLVVSVFFPIIAGFPLMQSFVVTLMLDVRYDMQDELLRAPPYPDRERQNLTLT